MEIVLTIFYFILFCFIINKISFFEDNVISKKWFISIFTIKVLTSILLTLIYTYYYTDRSTADIFKYFDDSKVMFEAIKTRPLDFLRMIFGINNDSLYFNETYYDNMRFWYSRHQTNLFTDSHTIIRFNAIVQLFSFGYFNVHNVFINFVSLIGLTAIFKIAKPYFSQYKKVLFYAIFLAPSVLFWGSGLLKESIIFLGVGILLLQLSKPFSLINMGLMVIALALLTYTKLYIIAALTPAILGYIFHQTILKEKALYSYLLSTLIVVGACFLLLNAPLKLNPIQLIIMKQHDFIDLMNQVQNSSSFNTDLLQNMTDVILSIPHALSTTFVRPFIWESNSPFMLMSATENIAFIIFLVISLFYFPRPVEALSLLHFGYFYKICILTLILFGFMFPS